jgi:hypothetical protein
MASVPLNLHPVPCSHPYNPHLLLQLVQHPHARFALLLLALGVGIHPLQLTLNAFLQGGLLPLLTLQQCGADQGSGGVWQPSQFTLLGQSRQDTAATLRACRWKSRTQHGG